MTPTVVNYGMGVDSTAVLVGLHARGERPDLILFADTGGEKAGTYAYLPIINAWLRERGWPEVTVVSYRPERAPYTTLEGNCLANETLPSIAFPRGGAPGTGGCSLKFKAAVMRSFIKGARRGPWKGAGWAPFHEAKARGAKTVRLVGYDDGAQDKKRSGKGTRIDAADFDFVYPLQLWGWDRARCELEILAAGLPLPPKSACYYCPASKQHEIVQLAVDEPDKFLRAIAMEDRAAAGKHGLGEKNGLGIRFRWRAFAEKEGVLAPGGNEIAMSEAALRERAAEIKRRTDAKLGAKKAKRAAADGLVRIERKAAA